MEVVINYWAVLLATVSSIIIGTIWYGPLFGKQWMRIVGISMGEMTPAVRRSMVHAYTIQTIASFIMAFVLAHILFYATDIIETEGIVSGLTGAIWLWIGFVVPATIGSVLWENRPWRYWFITAGYYLVTLGVMSIILTVWS